MLARSVVSSFRAAVARPAVSARTAVPAFRLYSAEAEKTEAPKEDAKDASADESSKKIAELEEKIKEMTKEMQYMRADYQTLSRRSAEERTKASDFAIAKFAKEIVGHTDVLQTALKHVPTPIEAGSTIEALFNGVDLTRKSLLQTLRLNGIKPMDELAGTPFDPNLHEATFQVPAAVAPKRKDGSSPEAGEIIDVQKPGWMIKERVLVPAQVGVVQIE